MVLAAPAMSLAIAPARAYRPVPSAEAGRYIVRLAETASEIESAYRLRHDVFNLELGSGDNSTGLEFDGYDLKCRHLIAIDRDTGETVGTYRLNTIETAGSINGFYSSTEFTIEDLPRDVIEQSVELGRACIARDHRNTRVLMLLWKTVLSFISLTEKRYLFGCCSVFTRDMEMGQAIYRHLDAGGYVHDKLAVQPCKDRLEFTDEPENKIEIKLPDLFNMYLRIGAKVCSRPMVDDSFGSIDFFVIFDINNLNEKYARLFG
jgi:putative hemolysin